MAGYKHQPGVTCTLVHQEALRLGVAAPPAASPAARGHIGRAGGRPGDRGGRRRGAALPCGRPRGAMEGAKRRGGALKRGGGGTWGLMARRALALFGPTRRGRGSDVLQCLGGYTDKQGGALGDHAPTLGGGQRWPRQQGGSRMDSALVGRDTGPGDSTERHQGSSPQGARGWVAYTQTQHKASGHPAGRWPRPRRRGRQHGGQHGMEAL
ncbi:MAG: hypothetical protein J3K34DRAFT_283368 [Monoraphidium minutum]|nr:MAG: hypothetical protein J3K34DRAFT_283368 [Monoraphidium minutum]